MRQMFVYTRIEQGGTPDAPVFKAFKDSFNVAFVKRSMTLPDGSVLVLLNDLHEESVETKTINPKTDKVVGTSRKREMFQSEIVLSAEDGERFYKLNSMG